MDQLDLFLFGYRDTHTRTHTHEAWEISHTTAGTTSGPHFSQHRDPWETLQVISEDPRENSPLRQVERVKDMSNEDSNRFAALAYIAEDIVNFVNKDKRVDDTNKHPGGDPQGQDKDRIDDSDTSSASGEPEQISAPS